MFTWARVEIPSLTKSKTSPLTSARFPCWSRVSPATQGRTLHTLRDHAAATGRESPHLMIPANRPARHSGRLKKRITEQWVDWQAWTEAGTPGIPMGIIVQSLSLKTSRRRIGRADSQGWRHRGHLLHLRGPHARQGQWISVWTSLQPKRSTPSQWGPVLRGRGRCWVTDCLASTLLCQSRAGCLQVGLASPPGSQTRTALRNPWESGTRTTR